MKKTFVSLLCALSALSLAAQDRAEYVNPVIRGDIPDPTVIRIGSTYYAAGTSSEWAPFYPLFTSKDLVNWTQVGHIFDRQPAWTVNSFWAPELFYHNGKVYCYYTARERATGMSYIGVAVADSPTGEFVDHGLIVRHGKEAIDAFVFDDGGQLYISWKAYGLENRPIELMAARLSSDGLRVEGEPFTLLTDDERVGMEGQCHFKQGDYYYLVYASHGCCGFNSDYDVCVARSRFFAGPYEKYEGNPILHGGEGDFQSCGHGTMVESPDGRLFYLCHAYVSGNGFFVGRQPILQEMELTADGWLRFKGGDLAQARRPMPFGGTEQALPAGFEDSFDADKLKVDWSWNYPYADVDAAFRQGKLYLSGRLKEGSRQGVALCVRAQSPDYVCETRVQNQGKSLKGLTLYGDDGNLLVWGVSDGKYLLKLVKDGQESVLFEAPCPDASPRLRFTLAGGTGLRFYYYDDSGAGWTNVRRDLFDGRDLLRWDRVQRPGLFQSGDADEPGVFDYFKLTNASGGGGNP